jgi:hypothetical protein
MSAERPKISDVPRAALLARSMEELADLREALAIQELPDGRISTGGDWPDKHDLVVLTLEASGADYENAGDPTNHTNICYGVLLPADISFEVVNVAERAMRAELERLGVDTDEIDNCDPPPPHPAVELLKYIWTEGASDQRTLDRIDALLRQLGALP